MMRSVLSQFVKLKRKQTGLTQVDLSQKAGVGLRFVRDLEQGKVSLRLDKVNQVLYLFGHEVGALKMLPKTKPVETHSPKTKSKPINSKKKISSKKKNKSNRPKKSRRK